jgi:TonB family protein
VFGDRPSFLRRRLERLRSGRRFEIMFVHRMSVGVALLVALAVSFVPQGPAAMAQADTVKRSLSDLASADLEISLDVAEMSVEDVLDLLYRLGGPEFRVVGPVPEQPVTLSLDHITMQEALEQLAMHGGLRYHVLGPELLEVRAGSRAGAGEVATPKLVPSSKRPPKYPPEARADAIQGSVILQALIQADGSITELTALHVDPEGYQPFVDAAIEAVSQWQYEPATRNGKPVDTYFTVVVEFKLN